MDSLSILKSARVMISTSSLDRIEKSLKIRVEGSVFSVRVMEEFECSCNLTKRFTSVSDDEANGDWSDDCAYYNDGQIGDGKFCDKLSKDPTEATIAC